MEQKIITYIMDNMSFQKKIVLVLILYIFITYIYYILYLHIFINYFYNNYFQCINISTVSFLNLFIIGWSRDVRFTRRSKMSRREDTFHSRPREENLSIAVTRVPIMKQRWSRDRRYARLVRHASAMRPRMHSRTPYGRRTPEATPAAL